MSHLPTGNQPAVDTQATIFVLWSESFDEASAVIFITELRDAGLRVKVVGPTSRPVAGVHGLALVTDLTMEQALPLTKQPVRWVILPCGAVGGQRLSNDPRVRTFLLQAHQHGACFITSPVGAAALARLGGSVFAAMQVRIFPANDELFDYVRRLVAAL